MEKSKIQLLTDEVLSFNNKIVIDELTYSTNKLDIKFLNAISEEIKDLTFTTKASYIILEKDRNSALMAQSLTLYKKGSEDAVEAKEEAKEIVIEEIS